jgi:Sec-independent protein translocase protein TatA
MEFLGVGPLELFFILIIALIFLGPRDMVKAGRTMGKYMRKIVMSPTWRMVQQTSRELRTLPNRMIREAGMEEDIKDLDQLRKEMGNQIGAIRKPFSAAADEVNTNLQAAQSDLSVEGAAEAHATESMKSEMTPSSQTAEQADLSAWTTAPSAAKLKKVTAMAQESDPSGATDGDVPASAETQNPNTA